MTWYICVCFQVSCHLEMSYFEVYNEKIHDLLVARENQNHRMPVSTTNNSAPSTTISLVNTSYREARP